MKLSSLPHSQFEFIRFRKRETPPFSFNRTKTSNSLHRSPYIQPISPFFGLIVESTPSYQPELWNPLYIGTRTNCEGNRDRIFPSPTVFDDKPALISCYPRLFPIERASKERYPPSLPPSFPLSLLFFFFFLLEKKSEEEDCRTRRKSKVRQHTHTHTLSCKWSRNTFASTRRFRSFKGRSKDVRDETSRRSFQWKYIYSCTSCKVATSFSSLISTRVQREAGRSHTLTRNVNNVSSNGCLPRSILTTFAVPRRSFGREDFCKRTSVYRNSRVSRGSKKSWFIRETREQVWGFVRVLKFLEMLG